jgi:small membrane protein
VIIQIILILGLLLCLLYAFIQRQKSRLLSRAMSIVALTGMYLVLFPEHTNTLAHLVGVGRGVDLLLYCWLVISIIVSMHLQIQILQLHGLITQLVREMAVQGARRSAAEAGTGTHFDT